MNNPLPVKKWITFSKKQENEKLIAAGLTVALGPFGAHRLYLGTKPHVPIIYTLTLGGFAIIPLVDMGHILFSKDITPYKDNPKVIMWKK
ncbi:MAG: TM2 domain-containing protein [Flavobacteriales bacterium]